MLIQLNIENHILHTISKKNYVVSSSFVCDSLISSLLRLVLHWCEWWFVHGNEFHNIYAPWDREFCEHKMPFYIELPLTKWTTFILRAGLHYGGEVHRSWKKGHFSIVISRKCNSWPVGVYTRWRKQWWWTFLMDDKMTWPPYVAALFGVGLFRRRSFLSGLFLRRSPTQ